MDSKMSWLLPMMTKLCAKFSKEIPLLNDKQMLKKFLSADFRILHDLLENKIQSEPNFIEFEKVLQNFKEAELSDQIWMKIMSNKIDSIKILNANIIFHRLQNGLQRRTDIDKENGIWNEFNLTVKKLFTQQNWNLKNFQTFMPKIKSSKDFQNFVKLLNFVYEYDFKFEAFDFDNLPPFSSDWLKYAAKIATKKAFSESSKILEPDQIIKLIAESSTSDDSLNYDTISSLYKEHLEEYNKLQKNISDLPALTKEISKFRKLNLSEKQTHWLFNGQAKIAAAVFAINKFFGVELRPAQIMAILISMKSREQKTGKLLQVPTGEGKTMIIAALAIIEAINGVKVDIVTNSTELAVTQYEKLKLFYAKLGFVVQHNANGNASKVAYNNVEILINVHNDFPEIIKDPASILNYEFSYEVYEADIIYGDAQDYLADILKSEFMGQNIRHDREFELVIVDEVDSMMIDGRNDSVRLSSETPGMNDILQIYTAIWSQIRNIRSSTKIIDGIWCYTSGEKVIKLDENQTVESFAQEACLSYLRKMLSFDALTDEEEGSGENWDEKITGSDGTNVKAKFPKLEIFEYLREYVEKQLPKWINSATEAMFNMRPGFDFVLKNDQIVVVDASNTGVHQPTMQWSDGLHQFLQMKHGYYLKPEVLATNYMSKLSFFQRYGSNILGLTGTIGGESSRRFLNKVYNVKFADIPPLKKRRHYEMSPILCASNDEWMKEIVVSTIIKLQAGRAVLIISNYIDHAERIAKSLQIHFDSNVILYTDKDGSAVTEKQIKPGQCIVATNIAGRGTDLMISEEVEKLGGLHVLLTFLPENDRVERQNIGRTSRTGNRGTSQMVLNLQVSNILLAFIKNTDSGSYLSDNSILESLRKLRDDKSLQAVDKLLEEIKITQNRDEAFKKFMEIRETILKQITKDTVEKEFEPFINATDVISNPYDAVKAAAQFFEIKSSIFGIESSTFGSFDEKKLDAADNLLEKAEKMDSKFCAPAYCYRGVVAIKKYKNDKQSASIEKAIKCFQMAKDALELKKIYLYTMMQITIPGENITENVKPKKLLHSQLGRQITLITSLIHNIETLIGRNVQAELDEYEKTLQNPEEKLSNDERENLQKQRDELKANQKLLEDGVLKPLITSKADITIDSEPLKKVLPPSEREELFEKEIAQFENDHFKTILTVKERPPINWWAVSIIAGAAVLQIVGGASAAIFSLGIGASVGFALLQEGVCDIIYAVKNGLINRNLNWVTYGIRKAISLTITMFSFGFGAIQAAANGVRMGKKAMGELLIGTANRVTKEGLKLACKAIGSAVTTEVTKTAISSTMDYFCAETVEKGISSMIQSTVRQIFVSQIGNDQNLLKLLKCDEKNENLKYSAIFTQEVLGIFNDSSFIQQMRGETMNVVNKISEVANAEIKLCTQILQKIEASTMLYKLTTIFTTSSLSQKLSNIVVKNHADIEKTLAKNVDAVNTNADYAYAQTTPLSVNDFLQRLSKEISDIIASQLSGVAQQLIANKISKELINWSSSVRKEIEKHRECFIDSKNVIEKLEEKRKTVTSKEENETIDYIKNIATDGPGDIRQAKYLADVIGQPIAVHTVDNNGEKRIFIVGNKYSQKPTIKLYYERASNDSNVGHYTLADGTPITSSGKNSCLFDALSKVTEYEPDLLRQSAANVMVNQEYKPPKELFELSPAVLKHCKVPNNHDDEVAAVQEAYKTRGYYTSKNTFIHLRPEIVEKLVQDYVKTLPAEVHEKLVEDHKNKADKFNEHNEYFVLKVPTVVSEHDMDKETNVIKTTAQSLLKEVKFLLKYNGTKVDAFHMYPVETDELFPTDRTYDKKEGINDKPFYSYDQ
uniref:Chloroplast protein-transporting ATPase n=1 Tax=Panagrolaimus sp. ES5 TaxID=591445 RepID=A0AC34FF64_9BILA